MAQNSRNEHEHDDALLHLGPALVERTVHIATEASVLPLLVEAGLPHKVLSVACFLGFLLVAIMTHHDWCRLKSEWSKSRFGKSTLLFGGATLCDVVDALLRFVVLGFLPIAHMSAHSAEKLGHGAALFAIALIVLAETKSRSSRKESQRRRGGSRHHKRHKPKRS